MKFIPFSDVSAEDFLPLVNDETLRKHLIDHPIFDVAGVRAWMDEKRRIDALPGCRVRAVLIDGALVGWCGLQPDEEGIEIAIVIARAGWGRGLAIFHEMMGWARTMGHQEVVFHLLGTRPPYRSLARRATRVKKTTLSGHSFTTYYFSVQSWSRP
ncbi:GNAT family N-acetyltransferase [Aeromonas sp. S16(2024)]